MLTYKMYGALLVALLLQFSGITQAQSIQFNSIDNTQARVKQTPDGIDQERIYYQLNADLFESGTILSPGDVLEVEIRPGEYKNLVVQRVENYFAETVSVRASDPENRAQSFSFTYHHGGINGMYHASHTETIFFEHEPSTGENYLSKTSVHGDDIQSCTVHAEHGNIPLPDLSSRKKTKNGQSLRSPNIAAMGGESLDDNITVDLLIAYTQKAEDYANNESAYNNIDALLAQALNLSQAGLDNSDIGVTLRPVHSYKTSYNDDGLEDVEGDDHLRRLTAGAEDTPPDIDDEEYQGFMEEVHTLRDEYGADLVALIASEPNTGGIAWMNNSPAGRPELGFSVNRAEQVGHSFTLVHEIGHNFGNAHARNQDEADAGPLGGLFSYSTGYLSPEGYNTIMAYGEQPLPYFSNPEFFDTSTNQYLGTNRANSVLTMQQVKRSIASYRLPQESPPEAVIVDNSITISLTDDNNRVTVPIPINNNGPSDLIWSIDFDLTATSTGPAMKEKGISHTAVLEKQSYAVPTLMSNIFAAAQDDGTIFETGFEPEDGFIELGATDTLGMWRVLIEDDMQFNASNENPSSGLQHIRMQSSAQPDPNLSSIAVSPFFGLQPFGEYEVSMDVAINQSASGEKERFDIYLFDGDTEEVSAGVVFSTDNESDTNRMYTYGRNRENGVDNFYGSLLTYPGNSEYFNLRIIYNAGAGSLDYYVDDQLVSSLPYAAGKKPDFIWLIHSNEVANTHMDVDNIRIRRTAAPFSWLDVNQFGGVTTPADQDELLLTFDANGVPNGRYETELIISSNDPENPTAQIPITVNVNLDEPIGQPSAPDEIALEQNYPNPFNPSTTIKYDLDDSYPVSLDVFDITGKKVATLVNREQPAGSYAISFNGQSLSSGVYIYRLQTPAEVLTRKMVLVK